MSNDAQQMDGTILLRTIWKNDEFWVFSVFWLKLLYVSIVIVKAVYVLPMVLILKQDPWLLCSNSYLHKLAARGCLNEYEKLYCLFQFSTLSKIQGCILFKLVVHCFS